ncbi:MAG TPA: hypothetical protein VIH11_07125 [Gemmatimonadaceae bacterium]
MTVTALVTLPAVTRWYPGVESVGGWLSSVILLALLREGLDGGDVKIVAVRS